MTVNHIKTFKITTYNTKHTEHATNIFQVLSNIHIKKHLELHTNQYFLLIFMPRLGRT